jgi:carbonic anhydrase
VTTKQIQDDVTPEQVLELLLAGNRRFVAGETLERDPRRQVDATAAAQYPLAVVLACMDSRVATELVFDLGLGDVFSLRMAGNIVAEEALGSMEFGCAVAGAKLLLVLGHTRCGAVIATVDQLAEGPDPVAAECAHLPAITGPISESVRAETETTADRHGRNEAFVRRVAVVNVRRALEQIEASSAALRRLVAEGKIGLAGGIYDVVTGEVEILEAP